MVLGCPRMGWWVLDGLVGAPGWVGALVPPLKRFGAWAGGYSAYRMGFGSNSVVLFVWGDRDESLFFAQDTLLFLAICAGYFTFFAPRDGAGSRPQGGGQQKFASTRDA